MARKIEAGLDGIPVVILHRDEPGFLSLMASALKQRTRKPWQLFVVDNCSVLPESETELRRLEAEGAIVIRNPKNQWVLGFNSAIAHPAFNRKAPYYVFSDADIVVPEPDESGACWLTRMCRLMDEYACAGKIGLSLNLDYIGTRSDLQHIYREELAYAAGPRVGPLVVAPVDTTLAIYRPTAFMTREFKFFPGHKSLMRPYLYSFRTLLDFSAEHLGWTKYGQVRADVGDKVRCFTRYGGYVDRVTLSVARLHDRLYYRFLGPFWRTYWGAQVVFSVGRYMATHFPRRVHELQYSVRVPNIQGSGE